LTGYNLCEIVEQLSVACHSTKHFALCGNLSQRIHEQVNAKFVGIYARDYCDPD
jgi:hypothetical protein